MDRMKGTRASRKSIATKLGRVTHSSTSTAMDYMWFFSYISRKDRRGYASMADKLVISEKEEDVLKKT